MHLKKLLALKPHLIKPVVTLLGLVSLMKLTQKKSVFSMLIAYKIPNRWLDHLNIELKALPKDELSEEHQEIIDDVDAKCSRIKKMTDLF